MTMRELPSATMCSPASAVMLPSLQPFWLSDYLIAFQVNTATQKFLRTPTNELATSTLSSHR